MVDWTAITSCLGEFHGQNLCGLIQCKYFLTQRIVSCDVPEMQTPSILSFYHLQHVTFKFAAEAERACGRSWGRFLMQIMEAAYIICPHSTANCKGARESRLAWCPGETRNTHYWFASPFCGSAFIVSVVPLKWKPDIHLFQVFSASLKLQRKCSRICLWLSLCSTLPQGSSFPCFCLCCPHALKCHRWSAPSTASLFSKPHLLFSSASAQIPLPRLFLCCCPLLGWICIPSLCASICFSEHTYLL